MGFTDQIAIHPPASDLRRGDFLWRLSSARIEKASPFSTFPEHDRVLIILEGSGVRIVHQFSPGEVEITDVLPLEPYEFPGDVPTDCVLLGEPVVDLSLFIRKGLIESAVEVRDIHSDEAVSWFPSGSWNFAFAAQGSYAVSVASGAQSFEIRQSDSLRVDLTTPRGSDEIRLRQIDQVPGKLILISLAG